MFVLQTVIEFGIAALLIVGLFNEDRVVAFEDRIVAVIKKSIRRRKTAAAYKSTMPSSDRRHCA